jgi:hypothetical protein
MDSTWHRSALLATGFECDERETSTSLELTDEHPSVANIGVHDSTLKRRMAKPPRAISPTRVTALGPIAPERRTEARKGTLRDYTMWRFPAEYASASEEELTTALSGE